jgi:hypothetical protein
MFLAAVVPVLLGGLIFRRVPEHLHSPNPCISDQQRPLKDLLLDMYLTRKIESEATCNLSRRAVTALRPASSLRTSENDPEGHQ